jgi:hypothetical protein
MRPWSPAPCSAVSLPSAAARVHALRDVGRLRGDDVHDENAVGVENVVVIDVADLPDGIADDGL